jgi:hypothetical protein
MSMSLFGYLQGLNGRIALDRACIEWYKLPVGAWRSLVAYLNGVQRVAGSNPVAPTILI